MPPVNIYIPKKLQKEFINSGLEAYSHGKEYMEVFSLEKKPTGYYIETFYKLPFSKQTKGEVAFELDSFLAFQNKMKEENRYFGSIHTHIDMFTDAIPSEADYLSSAKWGEELLGICTIWEVGNRVKKTKTAINYFITNPPCIKYYI